MLLPVGRCQAIRTLHSRHKRRGAAHTLHIPRAQRVGASFNVENGAEAARSNSRSNSYSRRKPFGVTNSSLIPTL
eukprot:COSAG04_NODE_1645_length_6065_cov_12.892558_9_plen_75_part_00